MTAPLTEVELAYVEGRLNHWIRFGRWRSERFIGRSRRIVDFAPGDVFAYLRWEANDYGTIAAGIVIVRARGAGFSTVRGVRPGGELLLRLDGWQRVQRALAAIDAVERLGIDAADAAPEHWRHVHNRLLIGEAPRAYDRDHHRAWLLRRRIDACK